MEIQFVKDCGHRKEGEVYDFAYPHANQYVSSGFAVQYVDVERETIIDGSLLNPEPPAEDEEPKLSQKVNAALRIAGYDTFEELEAASDEDLLAVPSIGKAALAQIREIAKYVPEIGEEEEE